jgi:hypothetical protein
MAHKQVLFRSAAHEKLLRGATQLADAVRVTLGPKSKSVLIQKKWGAHVVCNDGVTIAKEFASRTLKTISARRSSGKRRRRLANSSATALALQQLSHTRSSPMGPATSWGRKRDRSQAWFGSSCKSGN